MLPPGHAEMYHVNIPKYPSETTPEGHTREEAAVHLFHPSTGKRRSRPGPERFLPAGAHTLLGLRIENGEALVARIRQGFPVEVIDRLTRELAIPQQTLLRIIALPTATLTRRRAKKRLSPQESDRVYRVAAAYHSVLRLFDGDEEAARRWLNEPAKALGGNTPLNHLDTEAGADAVQNLIGRLEHGVIT